MFFNTNVHQSDFLVDLVTGCFIMLAFLIFSWIFSFYFIGDCRVLVKKWENCDENENYKIKLKFFIKTVNGEQYVNNTFVLAIPGDNNIRANVSLEMRVGNQYIYLFSINEKRSCDALNKYLGEFWYDMERHAGMIPGLCPIVKGRYQLHNYLLDWDKMPTLRNFPLGNLRVTFTGYVNKNEVVACFILEGTNEI